MGALGIMRSTIDLDFLVNADDLPAVAKILDTYGYHCVYKTENVSQYVADIKIFGEIDLLHAFRKISLSMLKRAKKIAVLEGKCSLKVLQPEDIIGLKLQALSNDTSRSQREYADIENIMAYFNKKLDWTLLKEYFTVFKKTKEFEKLRKKHGKT